MIVSKNIVQAYCILTMSFMIALTVIFAIDNVWVHIIAVWFLAATAIKICNMDFLHPYTWFSVGFGLYSTAYPMLYAMGYDINGYTYDNLLMSLVAMFFFLLAVGPRKELNDGSKALNIIPDISFNIDRLVFIFSILCIVFSLYFHFKGYSGKSAMKDANDYAFRIGVYIARFLCILTLFQLCRKNTKNASYRKTVILGIAASLCFTFFTGERDVFFRYIAILLIFLFVSKKLTKKHLLYLVPLCFTLLVMSVYFKYFFLRGTLDDRFSGKGVIYTFLRSDFYSAGSNLQYLLNRPWTEGSLGWTVLLTEIIYPLGTSRTFIAPSSWFNTVVHTGGYKGYAFSLVGTGYVIHGIPGIIAVFICAGLITKYVYIKSRKDAKWMSAYIYMIPTVIFASRQSLNTITTAFVRIILVSFLILYIANRLRHKGKKHSYDVAYVNQKAIDFREQ